METKKVHIGTLLSLTDGRLLSPNGFGELQDFMDWLANESLATFGMVAFAGPAKAIVLKQHPHLTDQEIRNFINDGIKNIGNPSTKELREEGFNKFIQTLNGKFGSDENGMIEITKTDKHFLPKDSKENLFDIITGQD